MKALITAAGLGTRFGTLTENNNKCLLEVGGRSLLDVSINILNSCGINDIVIVTGHCYDKIEAAFKSRAKFSFNPFYQISGILPSLWLGGKFIDNDEFVFVTGDSLYHPNILKNCLESTADIAVCVEEKKCDAEDSKVIIQGDSIIDIGKNIPINSATGEFVGMLKVSKTASPYFFEEIEKMLKQGKVNGYVADVIMQMDPKKYKITPVYTNPYPRIEIDSILDLKKAQDIFINSIREDL